MIYRPRSAIQLNSNRKTTLSSRIALRPIQPRPAISQVYYFSTFPTTKTSEMNVKSIFVNLPVKDLKKTRAFWTNLGFSFQDQFSDDKALCLVLQEGLMYSMLISHEMFSSFTDRPIADSSTTQVLTALAVDSKEQVDQIVKLALENGATRYRPSVDHGWMYYDSFADLDGHQWEIMFTDPTPLTS